MFKRVLLKFSGEMLQGKSGEPIDFKVLEDFARRIAPFHATKIGMVVVLGGGNLWRYRDQKRNSLGRVESDFMGMLATVMNGVAMQNALERCGIPARVCSALSISEGVESYTVRKARHHLAKGRVVICVAGTGHPYFTTDTAAALRALELECDVVLKATKVDGVYDRDPMKHSKAKRYTTISFDEVLAKNLSFMDATAVSLCREGNLPVIVFDWLKKGNFEAVMAEKKVGTRVVAERSKIQEPNFK